MQKLRNCTDEIVSEALISGRWSLFPSVDEVLDQIDLIKERRRQESGEREWNSYRLEQKRAAEDGRLASEADYSQMREALQKMGMSQPTIKSFPKPAPPPQQTEAQFADRKEMLRQQTEKIFAMRQKNDDATRKT